MKPKKPKIFVLFSTVCVQLYTFGLSFSWWCYILSSPSHFPFHSLPLSLFSLLLSLGLALSLFLKKSVKGKEAGVTLGLLGLFFWVLHCWRRVLTFYGFRILQMNYVAQRRHKCSFLFLKATLKDCSHRIKPPNSAASEGFYDIVKPSGKHLVYGIITLLDYDIQMKTKMLFCTVTCKLHIHESTLIPKNLWR